ncbi:unnamed protein product [Owenia fusiformis]|uniref:Uncharacterized protein n=1 Tax=Owenia fusiformis TaxID=6347 RepID=A0A8J1XP25_OWEFU|nr:unnamed protein product [Owenia fusiformis]
MEYLLNISLISDVLFKNLYEDDLSAEGDIGLTFLDYESTEENSLFEKFPNDYETTFDKDLEHHCTMARLLRGLFTYGSSNESDSSSLPGTNMNLTCNFSFGNPGNYSFTRDFSVADPLVLKIGRLFYSYMTPVIILIGLVGNSLSLKVFTSSRMRKQSSSFYLSSLSASDLMILLFYVFPSWLKEAIPFILSNRHTSTDILGYEGVCHTFVYLAYVFRFISVWLITIFTIERYIGICHPLRRREICTRACAKRGIVSLVLASLTLFLVKPFISGIFETVPGSGVRKCTSNPRFKYPSFVFDSSFAVLTTLVPFIVIVCLNTVIVKKVLQHKRQQKIDGIKKENTIKIEFTFILLAISTCFITLNLPYFVTWCRKFELSEFISKETFSLITKLDTYKRIQGMVLITQTIFYMNYCANFFLYSLTGRYFRRELRNLFLSLRRSPSTRRSSRSSYTHTFSRISQSSKASTKHTWV